MYKTDQRVSSNIALKGSYTFLKKFRCHDTKDTDNQCQDTGKSNFVQDGYLELNTLIFWMRSFVLMKVVCKECHLFDKLDF